VKQDGNGYPIQPVTTIAGIYDDETKLEKDLAGIVKNPYFGSGSHAVTTYKLNEDYSGYSKYWKD
jgi:hypothetical protein